MKIFDLDFFGGLLKLAFEYIILITAFIAVPVLINISRKVLKRWLPGEKGRKEKR